MEDNVLPISEDFHNGDIEWQPLALTLVEYPKGIFINHIFSTLLNVCTVLIHTFLSGDWLGKFLALLSLSPFGIGAGFLALILFRRDLHTVSIAKYTFVSLYNNNVN